MLPSSLSASLTKLIILFPCPSGASRLYYIQELRAVTSILLSPRGCATEYVYRFFLRESDSLECKPVCSALAVSCLTISRGILLCCTAYNVVRCRQSVRHGKFVVCLISASSDENFAQMFYPASERGTHSKSP
ncbi:hypothetical protein SCHPADRAFT_753656 [Schizopora paradoxa]|uniref:Uncharacterized protein n=1 Tax=Schizopora paradoxa TaxID=27342 RepID=A0A0H2QZQ4_9AGAM|nr:hypothetical protein SCHPADRAFT_753656 [Schizopora paradoxa]